MSERSKTFRKFVQLDGTMPDSFLMGKEYYASEMDGQMVEVYREEAISRHVTKKGFALFN